MEMFRILKKKTSKIKYTIWLYLPVINKNNNKDLLNYFNAIQGLGMGIQHNTQMIVGLMQRINEDVNKKKEKKNKDYDEMFG